MRFSEGEMTRRLDLARACMRDHEVGALLLFGSRANQAKVAWLTGFRDMHSCYLVVPESGDPTLLVSFLNHLPNAQEISRVTTSWGGDQPVEEVARLLRDAGAERIGLVGLASYSEVGMPYLHHQQLRELLPEVELVDLTAEFEALPLVKSAEEVEQLRESATMTDLALTAMAEHARPGMTESELVAHTEYAYRIRGAQVGITFLRSMPMDAPTGIVPAQIPSDRRLQRGDIIINELSASLGGYSGQVLWPIFVGADPTPQWQRLYDVAFATYQAMATALRADVTVGELIAAAEPIRAAGFDMCDDLLHGTGLGLCPPFVGPEDFDAPPADGGMHVREGMVIVLQPNPTTADGRMGIQLGSAMVVRADSAENLHAIPSGPLIAG